MTLPLKLKIIQVGKSAIQVQIDGEDYSLADVVHKELLRLKKVTFAGVAPPHPLIKTLTIQVHTDSIDPEKALKEAVKMCQERVSELQSAANQTFPNALRPIRQEKPAESDPPKSSVVV